MSSPLSKKFSKIRAEFPSLEDAFLFLKEYPDTETQIRVCRKLPDLYNFLYRCIRPAAGTASNFIYNPAQPQLQGMRHEFYYVSYRNTAGWLDTSFNDERSYDGRSSQHLVRDLFDASSTFAINNSIFDLVKSVEAIIWVTFDAFYSSDKNHSTSLLQPENLRMTKCQIEIYPCPKCGWEKALANANPLDNIHLYGSLNEYSLYGQGRSFGVAMDDPEMMAVRDELGVLTEKVCQNIWRAGLMELYDNQRKCFLTISLAGGIELKIGYALDYTTIKIKCGDVYLQLARNGRKAWPRDKFGRVIRGEEMIPNLELGLAGVQGTLSQCKDLVNRAIEAWPKS